MGMHKHRMIVAAIPLWLGVGAAFAQTATAPSATTPPGAAAAPSVATNRDAPDPASTSADPSNPPTPGKAASPSVSANRGSHGRPSRRHRPRPSAAGPGAGGAPSVANNPAGSGTGTDAPK